MFNTALFLIATGWLTLGETKPLTVDAIIQKNIEARGGADRWAKVKTLVVRGSYESFSTPAPFTIKRKRPNLYRFDHVMIGKSMTRCFDGKVAWWQGAMVRSPDAGRLIPEPQNRVTIREAHFESPLLAYHVQGFEITYLGDEKVDGVAHHKLEIILGEGQVETWFINSKTFLESKVAGYTYEYGRRMPIDIYFDDFRDVNGVLIPFLIEQEWHTRYRAFRVDTVEQNAPLAESVFAMNPAEK